MPTQINGLPAHVLLLHVVVVLIPLASVMLVLGALWPAARRKLTFLTPAVALVALVFVPITIHAGEWLRDRLPRSAAIQRHAELGDTLLPWAIGLFVMTVVVWQVDRRRDLVWRRSSPVESGTIPAGGGGTATMTRPDLASARTRQAVPVWVTAVISVLSVVVALGATIQLYRIGDSGAKAAWDYVHQLPSTNSK